MTTRNPLTAALRPATAGTASITVAAVLTTVLTCAAPAAARPPRYAWPLAPPHTVLRPFHTPATPYGPGHRGVDLAAPAGTPVLAAADGTVTFAGQVADRQVVTLSHAGGIRTTYEPVTPTVAIGRTVTRGSPIATLAPGHEGCPTTCLHWGAHRTTAKAGRTYLDPLRLLSATRVRLLPTGPPG
ncbi:hypothetical protein SUDANB95_00625 [Actinosynnema sp. ALI-1.44]